MRDRSGIVQVVFNKELAPAAHARAEEVTFANIVVAIRGRVSAARNPIRTWPRGEVEVFASELRILNTAKTPPFVVEDEVNADAKRRGCATAISICAGRVRSAIWRCGTA